MASEVELLEVFRLAEAATDGQIVAHVGDALASRWMGVSRFHDVDALTGRVLAIQSSLVHLDSPHTATSLALIAVVASLASLPAPALEV